MIWFFGADVSGSADDWSDDEITLPGISPEALKAKIKLPDGSWEMECYICHQRVRWAEPNQPSKLFKCYECINFWVRTR